MAQNGYSSQVTQQVRGLKETGSKSWTPRVAKVAVSLFHSKQQSTCDNSPKSFSEKKDAAI